MQHVNPLFPPQDDDTTTHADAANSFVLPRQHQKVDPPQAPSSQPGANQAADIIRQKIAEIYAEEPDAAAEQHKAESAKPRSKHQQVMYELSTSGRSLAEIQTAWHQYYVNLPDAEKYQVWQEFYQANGITPPQPAATREYRPPIRPASSPHAPTAAPSPHITPMPPAGSSIARRSATAAYQKHPTTADLRRIIRDKVSYNGRLQAKHHLQSLLFGIGVGCVTLVIFLFGFFNEVIIAPFIQPARAATATPIIIDPNSVTPTDTPEVIIPKINLEIPADFSQTSTDEATIENALENGIVHYPSTSLPGQIGNTAFFGHSSNNIFNPGKYKFAFVLLHELVPGDTFYITYNSKVYVYKIFSKQIVDPSDVGVLNPIAGHADTATLITCDPPGTSLHRLIVVGDQISPDPATNQSGSSLSPTNNTGSAELPGNGPTLWSRLWHALF